jgi:SpoVK/Ycf46/Vps4 family AAA+-type ATPase
LLVKTERLENAALLEAWLCRVNAPVSVEVEDGSVAERLSGLRLAAPAMNAAERKAEWQRQLGSLAGGLDAELDRVVEAFALDAAEIRATAQAIEEEAALEPALAGDADALGAAAWRLCRTAARRSLDELAVHVENRAGWADLVLPEPQTAILRQIAIHARQASRVNEEWGFAEQYARGLGLSALFSGPSGTGKTMAAGVLARELERDLYQIDLATVVSKYIGETEKHLRKIFEAAERSGAILLFDEADALFGKRSQVRDSHDRYANLEVSYLLQRMESYRGIAILTTNMQSALDPAFQRRLRFVVQFPFPDGPSRERIWRKVFPASAPKEALDFEKLAQLNVTGGSIRNIALLAAFLAADAGTAIAMRHLLEAARTEYAKLDRPLSPAETRGWV